MDWWKRKKSQAYENKQRLIRSTETGEMLLEALIKCCDGKSNPIKFFSADQILKATNNLYDCNIVPQKSTRVSELSEHGGWYLGTLDNHRTILLGKKSFEGAHDIAISSMVSGHVNFMKLAGCCLEFKDPVAVYYVEKKQYSRIDLSSVVSWRKRMKIAEGIATALAYLHTAFSRPFVYANMSLWNILLDEDGVAKLIHFTNCVSIPQGETFVKVDRLSGVYDYFDEDCLENGLVSEKTDAYGFGILMQKLLKGEERFHDWKSLSKRNSKSLSLSESFEEGSINECIDPKMFEKMDQVSDEERCQMEAFFVLSERCTGLRGEVPKMVQVAKELKKIIQAVSSSPSYEIYINSSPVILSNQG